MLRTASSLPLTGPLTLGSDPALFQTEPPACYRASWQLPGPDFHRQAATSLRTRRSTMALGHGVLAQNGMVGDELPRSATDVEASAQARPRLSQVLADLAAGDCAC